ncbi:MAG: hypothetical protein HY349_02805 [Nitrospirae bacterium]|nr:hypothetical protein [Nitrospirota bacterium]
MRRGCLNIGIIITVVLAGSIGPAVPTYAQSLEKTPRKDRGTFQLKETEITGKLKDILGSLKLLETEIVGTIERPRLSYSLPWKDPDPLLLDEGEIQGGFLEEIYTPLDKETYSREIRLERERQAP